MVFAHRRLEVGTSSGMVASSASVSGAIPERWPKRPAAVLDAKDEHSSRLRAVAAFADVSIVE
jgi:hypothetical protein